MSKEWVGALAALVAGAGFGLAQPAPQAPVLAEPAPYDRVSRTIASLPADLPPVTDPASPQAANPGLFPLSVTGLIATPPGCPEDLPACCDPAPRVAAGGGNEKRGDEIRYHLWAAVDPLLWWVRPGHTLPLIGADGSLNYGTQAGCRLTAGLENGRDDLGVEGSGFFLGRAGAEAAPSSTQLWGAEANMIGSTYGTQRVGIDLLGGLRYLTLEEDLAIGLAAGLPAAAADVPPTTILFSDSTRTRNQFFGGQLGSQVEVRWGRLTTNLLGKVAVGNMHQVTDVRTEALLAVASTPAAPAGGFVTLASPGGRQAHDEFGVVPELNLNVGYQLRPGLRFYAGYTFLYLNDVTRPGDQISTTVSQSAVPAALLSGAAQPPVNHTDFWAQGVNFGLALRY
jgi:hypothetical protein